MPKGGSETPKRSAWGRTRPTNRRGVCSGGRAAGSTSGARRLKESTAVKVDVAAQRESSVGRELLLSGGEATHDAVDLNVPRVFIPAPRAVGGVASVYAHVVGPGGGRRGIRDPI